MWKWYCRLCGERGQALTEAARDGVAFDHLYACDDRPELMIGQARWGKQLHVWSYPIGFQSFNEIGMLN
jgi:hypothetical protein